MTLAEVDPTLWAKIVAFGAWPAGARVQDRYGALWVTLTGGTPGTWVVLDSLSEGETSGTSGPPDSWLIMAATGDHIFTGAGGDIAVTFAAPWSLVGTDITLGVDNQTVHINTTGKYQIGYESSFTPSATAAGECGMYLDLTMADHDNLLLANGNGNSGNYDLGLETGVSQLIQDARLLQATKFTAGDSFKIHCFATLTAGSLSAGATLTINRIA